MVDYPPKTLELFLEDGTINGVIEVELSNWDGKAIKIPRKKFVEYSNELSEEGIYFLICENNETGEEEIYIGESSNVYDRNYNRLHNPNSRDFYDWKTMIVFMRKNLDSGKRLYAEHKIRVIAENCNRYNILTSQTRDEQLKKSYKYEMDEFIEHVRTILNILGYKLLEPFVENKENQIIWSLNINKDKKEIIDAKGIYNEETGDRDGIVITNNGTIYKYAFNEMKVIYPDSDVFSITQTLYFNNLKEELGNVSPSDLTLLIRYCEDVDNEYETEDMVFDTVGNSISVTNYNKEDIYVLINSEGIVNMNEHTREILDILSKYNISL